LSQEFGGETITEKVRARPSSYLTTLAEGTDAGRDHGNSGGPAEERKTAALVGASAGGKQFEKNFSVVLKTTTGSGKFIQKVPEAQIRCSKIYLRKRDGNRTDLFPTCC